MVDSGSLAADIIALSVILCFFSVYRIGLIYMNRGIFKDKNESTGTLPSIWPISLTGENHV